MKLRILRIGRLTYSELSAIGDVTGCSGSSGVRSDTFHGLEDFLTIGHSSEDCVLSIEMRCGDEAEEELRSVGVGTSVGHGEDTGTVVLVDEVLIGDLSAVDGLTTGTVSNGEVTTLGHETGDNSVPDTSLEVEGLSGFAGSLLSGAESSEVLGGLGGVGSESHFNAASSLATNGDIEEDVCHVDKVNLF